MPGYLVDPKARVQARGCDDGDRGKRHRQGGDHRVLHTEVAEGSQSPCLLAIDELRNLGDCDFFKVQEYHFMKIIMFSLFNVIEIFRNLVATIVSFTQQDREAVRKGGWVHSSLQRESVTRQLYRQPRRGRWPLSPG